MADRTPAKKAAAGIAGTAMAIIAIVFGVEGGFVDDPNDPGGATRWGCTEATARAGGYQGPISQMPQSVCADILYRLFIVRPGYLEIVKREPVLALEIIDSGVVAGPGRASPWFQQALNDFNRGGRDYPYTKVDGKVGPATIANFEALQRKRGRKKACELMVKSADAYQATHFQNLCRNSSKLSTFCVGWFDKRIGNAPIGHCGTGQL